MPWFQYDDPEVRDYHHFGRLQQGDVVEADPADHLPADATSDDRAGWRPDHRFAPVTAAHARKVIAARAAQAAARAEAQGPADTPPPTPTPDEDPGSGQEG